MKRKRFNHRKSFVQPELSYIPMEEAELPGMPEKPKNVEPKISDLVMGKIAESAALCARDPKVLKAFLQQLAQQYPADGQPISLISILPAGEKGINITLHPLPTLQKGEYRALVHKLGLKCVEGLTTTKKKELVHA